MRTQTHTEADPLASLPTTDSSGRSFEWLELLGRGSFGEVYLAKMRSPGGLEQLVAVKLLQPDLDPQDQAIERLRDEARLLASLRHPVILSAHDLVMLDSRVALVTEYIEGEDLSACFRGKDRMPPSTVLETIEAVASALDAAFQQHKVVHRDIKPSNIRIGVHGNVKLLDFGIARSGKPREASTQPLMRVGTQRYMSPERFGSMKDPAPPADVFALGAVLYLGVTGQSFLAKIELAQQCRLSLQVDQWNAYLEQRLSLLQTPALEPLGLQPLLRKMLSHDEASRPTASEVAEHTEELTAQFANHIRLSRWCRTRRWPASPLSAKPAASTAVTVPSQAVQTLLPGQLAQAPRQTEVRATPVPSTPRPASDRPTRPIRTEPPRLDSYAPVSSRTPAIDASTRRIGPGRWIAAATVLAGGFLAVVASSMLTFLLVVKLKAQLGPQVSSLSVATQPLAPEPQPAPEPPLTPEPLTPEPLTPEPPLAPEPPPTPELQPALEPQPAPEPRIIPRAETPEPISVERAPETSPPVVPAVPTVPTYKVLLTSQPPGAEIRLISTGALLGLTPQSVELPAGAVVVQLRAPGGAVTEQTLQIGKNGPSQYVWNTETDNFKATY